MCPVTPVPTSNNRPDQLINQDSQHQSLQIIHLVNYMDHAADYNPLSVFPHTFFGLADLNSSHIQKRNALEKY